jgi:hypothetical protein
LHTHTGKVESLQLEKGLVVDVGQQESGKPGAAGKAGNYGR